MNVFSHALLQHLDAVLSQVLRFERPADAILKHYFKENRKLGGQDRGALAETVYFLLRRYQWLSFWFQQADLVPTARLLYFANFIKIQGYSINHPDLKARMNDTEREQFKALKACKVESALLPKSAQYELPEWILTRLEKIFTEEEIKAVSESFKQPARLDLRVNAIKSNRENVLKVLAESGIEAEITPYSPVGIRIPMRTALYQHPLFLNGEVEVQDEGSQLLGYLVAPSRQDMVVDFCAGAGGKTLLLGAMMRSQGRLYAFDTNQKRLEKLKPRLKRSGLSNVTPHWISNENDVKIKRLHGKIDKVLVDAPCTGLGTLRRNPDLKFRQNEQTLQELTALQAKILESAAKLVKKGGRLIYATCSLLPEENEEIVQQFLATHSEFSLMPARDLFAQAKIELEMGEYCRLSPHRHGTDGFFGAVLVRH